MATYTVDYVVRSYREGQWDAGYWTTHHKKEDARDCVKRLNRPGSKGSFIPCFWKRVTEDNGKETWTPIPAESGR